MSGQIIKMINTIIETRSKGNSTIANVTKTKLILKGLDPAKFTDQSPDDEQAIDKLKVLATELGVTL